MSDETTNTTTTLELINKLIDTVEKQEKSNEQGHIVYYLKTARDLIKSLNSDVEKKDIATEQEKKA